MNHTKKTGRSLRPEASCGPLEHEKVQSHPEMLAIVGSSISNPNLTLPVGSSIHWWQLQPDTKLRAKWRAPAFECAQYHRPTKIHPMDILYTTIYETNDFAVTARARKNQRSRRRPSPSGCRRI